MFSLKEKSSENYIPILTPQNLQEEFDSSKSASQWRRLWTLVTIMSEIVSDNIPPKRG